jgi:type III pantothenate kinase
MAEKILLLDQGNSRLKFRLVSRTNQIIESGIFLNSIIPNQFDFWQRLQPDLVIICQSSALLIQPESMFPNANIHYFTHIDGIGLRWAYRQPERLGPDRMAAMIGASLKFPDQNLLIADAGSCLTIDLLDAGGLHLGGFISPGIRMRLRAMHAFTHSLPEEEIKYVSEIRPGSDTEECLQAGVMAGIVAEINSHFYHPYFDSKNAELCILCGGDSEYLAHLLKGSTFVADDLVFDGLFSVSQSINLS